LGFYFDQQLSFKEHTRYYSTKVLSTVKAMGMLGDSTQGLLPLQKWLLYQSCVVPIATYGFHLWYFAGAPTKVQVFLLATMQCKAALWILGAFCTSPTGGIEALVGLIPIHLHLKKLVKQFYLRAATLPFQQLVTWTTLLISGTALVRPNGPFTSWCMKILPTFGLLLVNIHPLSSMLFALRVLLHVWTSGELFSAISYQGCYFLSLKGGNHKPLQPSYTKGGSWLPFIGESVTLCARVT